MGQSFLSVIEQQIKHTPSCSVALPFPPWMNSICFCLVDCVRQSLESLFSFPESSTPYQTKPDFLSEVELVENSWIRVHLFHSYVEIVIFLCNNCHILSYNNYHLLSNHSMPSSGIKYLNWFTFRKTVGTPLSWQTSVNPHVNDLQLTFWELVDPLKWMFVSVGFSSRGCRVFHRFSEGIYDQN
jgi:hypothetical protein